MHHENEKNDMKMNLRIFIFALSSAGMSVFGQTLEECWLAAEQNYPLIEQYGLIDRTTELTVANIRKGWLPEVSANAQATYQSDVTSWPEEMTTMMRGTGINMKGLKLVSDGGYLATCSCSHFMTQELFTKTVKEAAKAVHKRLRQVEFRTQAPDHPILWAADESYYLKFIIFQVVDER